MRHVAHGIAAASIALLFSACGGDSGPAEPSSVSIGGTISGLTGSGLVLQNSGGNDLTIASGATTFAFTTKISTGAAYSVSVRTQPSSPTQSCTVTNGSGTASANVSNVAVACAANSATVGGTITGLVGSGLTLRLNGGPALSIAATATTFVFPAIASGTAYTVTIAVNPTGPSQTCTLANATGTAAGNTTNVAVTCTTNSFAIGGTITGLTGTGLTLRLNGGTPIAVAAGATSFVFPPIASGTAYTVAVGTSPTPTQACTITNATGTLGSLDVTNVAVSCVTLVVGGTVSGLTGTGLTVRLNGGTPLAIAAGATAFTFPTVFATGNDYRITIATQPTAQTCTMQRAQGRLASLVISNVAIACVANNTSPLSGTYLGGPFAYLTFFADGTFSFSERNDTPSCAPGNGNGIEYGVYNWNATTKVFNIVSTPIDTQDGCGGFSTPGQPFPAGVLLNKIGATLSFVVPGNPQALTATQITSTAGSLVGSFVSEDGVDGSFIVFHADGTYFAQEAQLGNGNGVLIGYERGCYTVNGGTFTTSLAVTCRPDARSAIDINGTGNFSSAAGAAITFSFTGPNTLVIGGTRTYSRIIPN